MIKHKRRLFVGVLLWLSVLPMIANTDKFYGLQEGLSNSHVNSIYQDRSGLIWVCTDNGLNSFDGLRFKTYYHILDNPASLDNNSVLSFSSSFSAAAVATSLAIK